MKVKEKWKKVFELSRKRITPSREAIVEVLEERGRHLSAEEIYSYLKEKQHKVGIATVYRNLELLSRMGIVHRVNFGDGKEHYEMARVPALHHHHLICTRCGKVVDYQDFQQEENEFVERLGRALGKKYDFLIQSHQLYFYGICRDCRLGGGEGVNKIQIPLTEMKTGEEGVVVGVREGEKFPRRLWILGLFPGKRIRKVSSSLVGGPVVVCCGTQELALGRGLASRVMVEVER